VRSLTLAALALLPSLLPHRAAAQLEPPSTGGYAELAHALTMLGHEKRVLVIGAHPDDEDTELLTVLVRGMGAEAAYLSLNRGEGGQNLIGTELGEALGLLRTEELLAARRLDGASQFFTRSYDFGFSKNLTDTWAHWPKDSVLKDVVRIIRRFRPQIVVSIFSGTPADGHGQHQAAGWAAQEAFRVAGDSDAFPELLAQEGLPSYAPRKLFRSTRFDTAATTLVLDGGALDPAVGQSFHQIAMRGRSLHRSQDMGQLQGIGPSRVRLGLLQDRTASSEVGLWNGLDTTLAALPLVQELPEPARSSVRQSLAQYAARVDSARALIAPQDRFGLLTLLQRAAGDLDGAEAQIDRALPAALTSRAHGNRQRDGDLLQGERVRLTRALIAGLDLIADVVATDSRVIPGQRLGVTASIWNAGNHPLDAAVCLRDGSIGWRLVDTAGTGTPVPVESSFGACLEKGGPSGAAPSADSVGSGQIETTRLEATIPAGAEYSTPYFLRLPRWGDLYQWDPSERGSWGLPFEPARLSYSIRVPGTAPVSSESREVTFRGNDQGSGEFRRPVTVVPRVDVRIDPDLDLWPLAARTPHTFTVTLRHGGPDTTRGTVRLQLPKGWRTTAPKPFLLTGPDDRDLLSFTVIPPRSARSGSVEIAAEARDAQGRAYDVGLRSVDHTHIHPRNWSRQAVASVRLADVTFPRLRHMAYLRGAADRIPEELQRLGLPVEIITGADLARSLSRYEVVVVGPRAFETDPDLPGNNARLLAYARTGGTVLVQYQQYGYFLGGFAPYPMTVGSRPPGRPNSAAATATRSSAQRVSGTALMGGHDRVTDETAPVTVLDPAASVVRMPNRIGAADWDGWVQERGLYFAHSWDKAWTPVLEMHDPGESPLEGGLLVASLGRGTYVYTGLSFFRQLPAGVPGAWRLFANLLALGGRPSGPSRPVTARPAPSTDSLKVEEE
jgi:LmbE family N-acetylglucosaminyl deacetylase